MPAGRPTARSPWRSATWPTTTSVGTQPAIQVVVHSSDGALTEGDGPSPRRGHLPARRRAALAVVSARPRGPPSPGRTTAVVLAGAGADTNEMVRVAADLKGAWRRSPRVPVEVNPTGSLPSVVGLQRGQPRRDAELGDALLAGHPGHPRARLRRAGRRRPAAAPHPAGLVASAGSLVLINELVPVSIWAMNFAMMFALALGIDYALFLVVRYRARAGVGRVAGAGDRRDHGHRRQGRAALRRRPCSCR